MPSPIPDPRPPATTLTQSIGAGGLHPSYSPNFCPAMRAPAVTKNPRIAALSAR